MVSSSIPLNAAENINGSDHPPALQDGTKEIKKRSTDIFANKPDSHHAIYTLPECLSLRESDIPRAGYGIWSNIEISEGTKFGHYEGAILTCESEKELESSYCWQISSGKQMIRVVDAEDESKSNWLRFINYASNEDKQNLVAFPYNGEIYYYAIKTILPGNELLVWYSEEYAEEIGIEWPNISEYERLPLMKFYGKGHKLCTMPLTRYAINFAWPKRKNDNCLTNDNIVSSFIDGRLSTTSLAKQDECAGMLSVDGNDISTTDNNSKCGKRCKVVKCDSPRQSSKLFKEVCSYDARKEAFSSNEKYKLRKGLILKHNEIQKNEKKSSSCDTDQKKFRMTNSKLHQLEIPFSCSNCDKKFKSTANLKIHLRSHKGKKSFYCKICKREFASGYLERHQWVHTEKSFPCKICNKMFKFSSSLRVHQRIHTGEKPFVCNICDKRFNTNRVKDHMRIHVDDRPFVCSICERGFKCSSNLRKHQITHTSERPFLCGICNKSFKWRRHLMGHQQVHIEYFSEECYTCTICEKKFNKRNSFKSHMRIHSNDNRFVCNICDKKFNQNHLLKRHLQTHVDERPFGCDICGKKFKCKTQLRIHLRTHTGEKPYACNICNKRFSQNANLRQHLSTHTAEKPFSCKICNKKFGQKSSVKIHMQTHKDEKSFICGTCNKGFAYGITLKRHMRTHTGEKPFSCNICKKQFNYKVSLKYHDQMHKRDSKNQT